MPESQEAGAEFVAPAAPVVGPEDLQEADLEAITAGVSLPEPGPVHIIGGSPVEPIGTPITNPLSIT